MEKSATFQIAQGESDVVRGDAVCVGQAALIFTVQEDDQPPPGKGESCTACVLMPALLAIPFQIWYPSIPQELPLVTSEIGHQFCFCEIPLV